MRRESIFVLIFLLILVIVFTYPAVTVLHRFIIGDLGDSFQFFGFQYLAKQEFYEGRFPFDWSNFWRYPYGVIVPNIVDATFLIILGLVFYQFTNNPVLVYNLSILTLLYLNAVVIYFSFRSKFGFLQSLSATIMYGFSFFVLSKLGGHFNLVFIAGFPAFLFSFLFFIESKASWRSIIYISLSLLACAFASLQYPMIFVGSLPVVIGIAYFFFKPEIREVVDIEIAHRMRISIALLVTFSTFMVFHGTKFLDLLQGKVIFPVSVISSTPFINFFSPNPYSRTVSSFFENNTPSWIEYVTFPGFIELILFCTALYILPRTKTVIYLTLVCLLMFVISAGVQEFLKPLWPYQYLFNLFPYSGIIEPGRFVVITYLFTTIFTLLFLNTIKSTWIHVVIILLLIITRLPYNIHINEVAVNPEFIKAVQQLPSRAVVDIPVRTDYANGQFYDKLSVLHGRPITNGYFHWSGNTPDSQQLTSLLEPYSCYSQPDFTESAFDKSDAVRLREEVLRQFRFYLIRTLVIHKDYGYTDPQCLRTRLYTETLLENPGQWAKIYEDDKNIIYWLQQL